jgi:hypothetical protein
MTQENEMTFLLRIAAASIVLTGVAATQVSAEDDGRMKYREECYRQQQQAGEVCGRYKKPAERQNCWQVLSDGYNRCFAAADRNWQAEQDQKKRKQRDADDCRRDRVSAAQSCWQMKDQAARTQCMDRINALPPCPTLDGESAK